MNLLQKIWKYKFHYVIVIPALLLILLYKGTSLFAAFRMSFTDFTFFEGLMNSDWVGWRNFINLWESIEFGQIFFNTIRLKLLYIIVSGLIAFVLALALSGLRSARIRNIFQTLFLLPYFIPTAVLAYSMMLLLSPNQSPQFRMETNALMQPGPWMTVFLIAEIVSTIGIPVVIAMAAISANESSNLVSRIYPALRAVMAFMLFQISTLLTVDFEVVHLLYNPLVYNVADTIDTYGFRTGFMNMQISAAAALWLTQFAVQLVLSILVYLLIRRWFYHDLFHREGEKSQQKSQLAKRETAVAWVVSLLYSIIALVPLILVIVYPIFGLGETTAIPGDEYFGLIEPSFR